MAQNEFTEQPGMRFRRALLQISKQLNESDVEQMKFLIAGLPQKPGFAELESATTGMAFFMPLVKNEDITEENHYLLGYLLAEIGQKALIKRFKEIMAGSGSPATRDSSSPSFSENSQNSSVSSVENTPKANPSSPPGSGISSPDPQTTSPTGSVATSTPTTSSKQDTVVTPKIPIVIPPSDVPTPSSKVSSRPLQSNDSPSKSPDFGQGSGPSPGFSPSPDGSVNSSQASVASGKSPPKTGDKSRSHDGLSDTPKTSQLQPMGTKPHVNSANGRTPQHPNVSGNIQMASDHRGKTLFTEDPRIESSQPIETRTVIQVNNANRSSLHHQTEKSSNSRMSADPQSSTATREPDPTVVKKLDQIDKPSPTQSGGLPQSNAISEVQHHQQLQSRQQGSMQNTQEGSYGYHTLTSVEVLGLATHRSLDLMTGPPPHPDDMGPTLQPPSESLEHTTPSHTQTPYEKKIGAAEKITTDGSKSPQVAPEHKFPDLTQQSRDVKVCGLEGQMGDLKLENQAHGITQSNQPNRGSAPVRGPVADLETDAPGEEEGSISSYKTEEGWFEKPPDNSHMIGSSSSVVPPSPVPLFPINLSSGDADVFKAFAPPPKTIHTSELFPTHPSVSDPAIFGGFPPPSSEQTPVHMSPLGWQLPMQHRADGYHGNRPETNVTSSESSWSNSRYTAAPSGSGGSAGPVGGPAVRRKNMSAPKSMERPSASSQVVARPQQQTSSRARVEYNAGADSALVLPKSRSQASKTPYQPHASQPRKQGSSRRNESEHLEGLKRKVADSIARQPRPARGRTPSVSQDHNDDEPLEQKTLRMYQTELSTPAKSGDNFIICAPTGSGKTLTAASICRHFHEKALAGGYPFKALFIVNIRQLTQQQTTAFRETMLKGSVGTIGETDLLKAVFFNPEYAVIMVTAQILVNALKRSPIPDLNLQDIQMIIFDECHHTIQDHPYNEIMKRFLKEKKMKLGSRREVGKSGPYLPQIIGLSASLGVGHGKDAFRHVLTLCSNMDAKNVTQVHEHKDELESHVNSPEQDLILTVAPRHAEKRDLGHIIVDIMTQIEADLWDLTPPPATQSYEQWIVDKRKTAELNSDRIRNVACKYLYEYNRALLLYEDLRAIDALLHIETYMNTRDVDHRLEPIEKLCRELFRAEQTDMKRICDEETDSHNPKLEELAKLLRHKFMEKPYSKGIVLTRMRLATLALEDFIKRTRILRGLPQPVKPVRLVGQGETDNFFMTESAQKKALDKFRQDDYCNLLVATDIAQEGLDMPACNFVIRYNFVSNEIGTVQSKGRARAKQSECFLIVEEGSQNETRELENRQKVINMQEAMQTLNQLPEAKRLQDITKRQDEIYKSMEEKEQMTKITHGIHTPEAVEILCKECNAPITSGNYMRKKGCHFTCIDPDVMKRIKIVKYGRPQVYRDTQNVGNFKCGNRTCGQQLGVAIYFLDGKVITHKGYGFKVQSFLFKLPDGSKMTFKQWKKVTFDIPEL